MSLLSSLGIYHLKAIVGGSMGGMQALQFAVDYPNLADDIISLAATYATRPWTIGFNKVAVEAIRRDPDSNMETMKKVILKKRDWMVLLLDVLPDISLTSLLILWMRSLVVTM